MSVLAAVSLAAVLPSLNPAQPKARNFHEARRKLGIPPPVRSNAAAFGGTLKKAAKAAFLARSNAEADRLHREQQHKRELARWFATLPPEEQTFARAHGLHEHLATGITFGPVGKGNEARDEEFADAADSAAASLDAHPVDAMEPAEGGVEIEELTHEEIAGAGEAFEAGLRWALDGADLVAMGHRAAVLIAAFRPCLAAGVPLDDALRDQFFKKVPGDYAAAGILFGRALERIRSGASLSAFGQQLYVVAYVLRPALIGTATLAAIGGLNGKTRQALAKQANSLRDVFAGLKAATMRADITRTRCQTSQLARA